jgi:hypothetical protein
VKLGVRVWQFASNLAAQFAPKAHWAANDMHAVVMAHCAATQPYAGSSRHDPRIAAAASSEVRWRQTALHFGARIALISSRDRRRGSPGAKSLGSALFACGTGQHVKKTAAAWIGCVGSHRGPRPPKALATCAPVHKRDCLPRSWAEHCHCS